MMMDESASTYDRRKLVKTNKYMLPRKLTMVTKVCAEVYFRNDEGLSRLTSTDVKIKLHKSKGNAEREEIHFR